MIKTPRQDLSEEQEFPWLLGRVPNGFWDHRPNRVRYFDWLGAELGFETDEDWYELRNRDFNVHYGAALLRVVYRSSVLTALQDYRPSVDWLPWRLGKTPRGFWRRAENRRAYMSWLEQLLGLQTREEWYRVTKADFVRNHGAGLLINHFGGSILETLRDYRPDVSWLPWLFGKVPHGYWDDPQHRRQYLGWLAEQCDFAAPEDWQQLDRRALSRTGGMGLLAGYYDGSVQRVRDEAGRWQITSDSDSGH